VNVGLNLHIFSGFPTTPVRTRNNDNTDHINYNNSYNPISGVPMLREAPAMTVRQNLGELLNEVQYKRDKIIITKAGKPVAALIDMPLFERLREMDREFERMTRQLRQAFQDVPESEVDALLDEAIAHARKRNKEA